MNHKCNEISLCFGCTMYSWSDPTVEDANCLVY